MRWAGHVTPRGRGQLHKGIWWRNVRERDPLEDTGIDGRIILRWVFRKWNEGHGMVLTLGRDRWRALENAIMNIRIP
jgi:hypothetical protein